jgi:hypothetical protein
MKGAKGWGSLAYIILDACSKYHEFLKIVVGFDYIFVDSVGVSRESSLKGMHPDILNKHSEIRYVWYSNKYVHYYFLNCFYVVSWINIMLAQRV